VSSKSAIVRNKVTRSASPSP